MDIEMLIGDLLDMYEEELESMEVSGFTTVKFSSEYVDNLSEHLLNRTIEILCSYDLIDDGPPPDLELDEEPEDFIEVLNTS